LLKKNKLVTMTRLLDEVAATDVGNKSRELSANRWEITAVSYADVKRNAGRFQPRKDHTGMRRAWCERRYERDSPVLRDRQQQRRQSPRFTHQLRFELSQTASLQ
jgi:hypothetical protein